MSNKVQEGLRRFWKMVKQVEKVLGRIPKGSFKRFIIVNWFLLWLGSKSRRLWHDSFIYRLNSLLINWRSFRVLTKALFLTLIFYIVVGFYKCRCAFFSMALLSSFKRRHWPDNEKIITKHLVFGLISKSVLKLSMITKSKNISSIKYHFISSHLLLVKKKKI